MKTHRSLWLITLLFYTSGCTVYAPVYFPGEETPPIPETETYKTDDGIGDNRKSDASPKIVKKGARLRLTLKTGEEISGEVIEIGEDYLAFGKVGNYGLEKQYYHLDDIAKIEVSLTTSFTKIMTSTLVIVGVVLLALTAMYARGMSGYYN
ncbi:MAG: hypothetical protein GY780_00275 [bacterium]|nr:hypothetical protein [bacterium]